MRIFGEPRVPPAAVRADDWQGWTRRRDLEQVLSAPALPLSPPVLEIGCGDGRLGQALAARAGTVFPCDIHPRARVARLSVADARALPFAEATFATIFSSNALEHVPELPRALAEFGRVLRPGGVMLHFMPTAFWKVLQLWLYPLYLARLQLRKYAGADTPRLMAKLDLGLDRRRTPDDRSLGARLRKLAPPVHGIAANHLQELLLFREGRWRRTFAANGWRVVRADRLYLHSAYGLLPHRLLRLREILARAGFCATKAYWLRPDAAEGGAA